MTTNAEQAGLATAAAETGDDTPQRRGVLVRPERRLSDEQIRLIDGVSRDLLQDPGLLCYSAEAAEVFKRGGAKVDDSSTPARVRIPSKTLDECLATAPSRVPAVRRVV